MPSHMPQLSHYNHQNGFISASIGHSNFHRVIHDQWFSDALQIALSRYYSFAPQAPRSSVRHQPPNLHDASHRGLISSRRFGVQCCHTAH